MVIHIRVYTDTRLAHAKVHTVMQRLLEPFKSACTNILDLDSSRTSPPIHAMTLHSSTSSAVYAQPVFDPESKQNENKCPPPFESLHTAYSVHR